MAAEAIAARSLRAATIHFDALLSFEPVALPDRDELVVCWSAASTCLPL